MSLKSTRATGTDGIPAHFWKSTADAVLIPLTDLVNACLSQSRVPDQWKESIVKPVLKKGKGNTSPDSYRPVSVMNSLSKVFESVILEQLTDSKTLLREFITETGR